MKLIVTNYKEGVGVFGFEDSSLVEANIFNEKQQICMGDIYLGRVNKMLPNMNACFVKIGDCEEIFLPFSEMKESVKSGDYTLIQINKEASKGKQPLGSTNLSIAGLYCVVNYEPHSLEVSTKLSLEERKFWKQTLKDYLASDKLSKEEKELLLKYCVIIRTNVSECKDESLVISEWLSLCKQLDYILEKGKNQSLFTKLYCEEKQYLSHIKNISQNNLEEIITDEISLYDELKKRFEHKVRLYQDEFPLHKLYSLETKLSDALNKKVWLKCGGFLVIEPTEALTVIDVNSGKFEKKKNAEEYYKTVNEEAALEIARQIKLRNISGIIIIDFINMQSEVNQKTLVDTLKKAVSKDKVKTIVFGMTALGLVELTRAKNAKPLWEQLK